MRCPICGGSLAQVVYIPPDSGRQYINYLCSRCHRRFRFAKIRHLALGFPLTFKIKRDEVLYDGNAAYFVHSKVLVRKVGDRFVLSAFGESVILPKFKNPPFPLSELK